MSQILFRGNRVAEKGLNEGGVNWGSPRMPYGAAILRLRFIALLSRCYRSVGVLGRLWSVSYCRKHRVEVVGDMLNMIGLFMMPEYNGRSRRHVVVET